MSQIKLLEEPIDSRFEGTIIDLETIGEFDKSFNDSRLYRPHKITVFGCITQESLKVFFARNEKELTGLKQKIPEIMESLPRPWSAFNALFEMGVLFHNTSKKFVFEQELNAEKFEGKWRAVQELKLAQYSDPFNDRGALCIDAWKKGEIEKIIAHNRADLLKERDILLRRGYRKPEEMVFKD